MSTQYYVAQSLDGYIAETDHTLDWLTKFGGDSTDVSEVTEGGYDRFYAQVGAVAMGSATYEWILAEVDEWPYSGIPAWVFTSREFTAPDGADVRFANGVIAPLHDEMTTAAGERNLWLVGGGNLASRFADEGLLDELILTVVPVWLGSGMPTFATRLEGEQLRRTGTQPFGNGMTELRYDFVR